MSQEPLNRRERIGFVVALVGFACFGFAWIVLLGPRSDPNVEAYIPMGAGLLIAAVGGLIFRGGKTAGDHHKDPPRGEDQSYGEY